MSGSPGRGATDAAYLPVVIHPRVRPPAAAGPPGAVVRAISTRSCVYMCVIRCGV